MTVQKQASQRRGVVAVILRCRKLLVIRRSMQVEAPGALCFPGGAIEAGESEQQALVREIREELSVEVQPLHRVWRSVTPWNVSLAWWRADLPADLQPTANPAEVSAIHWHTPAEAADLPDLLEGNRQFLLAVVRGEIELA